MPKITWSPEDEEVLLAAHHEVLTVEAQSEIETLGDRLAKLPVGPKEQNRERIGNVVLRTLEGAIDPRVATDQIGSLRTSRLANCKTLGRPAFSLQSPKTDNQTTFSLANAAAATLEVRARTGALNGAHYPSSEEFILPFNRATAWIGAPVAIPQHGSPTRGPLAILDVSIQLQVEQIWSNVPEPIPGNASDMLWTVAGNENLPLRGTAVAWCRAGLTLHGGNGTRSRRAIDFVSGWVNRDGCNQKNYSPEGLVTLSHAVVISPELIVAGIFVDITCFAAAEKSQKDSSLSAYSELRCKRGDGFPPPSRLRVIPERVKIHLCEMPLLTK